MDSYLTALISYKNRKYEECATLCTKILDREPHDQVIINLIILNPWITKMGTILTPHVLICITTTSNS